MSLNDATVSGCRLSKWCGKKTVEIGFAPVLFNDAVSAVHVISRVIIGQPSFFFNWNLER